MDKKNWLVIAGVAALALVLLLGVKYLPRPAQDVEETMVIICVDGREYTRVPLSSVQKVTVEQEDGAVNVIEINGHGALMHSSTCDNQLCVKMGEITEENWMYMPIVCLPNRVSVELAVSE